MSARDAWLRLLQAGQTSSAAWTAAFAELGNAVAITAAAPTHLKRFGLTDSTLERLQHPDQQRLTAWQDWLSQRDHTLLTRDDDAWPPQLAAASDAPLALWLRGTQPELLSAPQIAIVGSRNATAGGAANAQAFAEAFGRAGLTVTSGLAAGIDAAAHSGALRTPSSTIAVLGNGIDSIYPHEHASLAAQIAAKGVIVSEYAPGTPPQRHRFPARNRIIATLSFGVLVVEAGQQSGSLITARLAGERGREIFALPGSIHNPVARGCHRLIRDGAKLVESAQDVLVELAPALRHALETAATSSSAAAPAPPDRNRAGAAQSTSTLASEHFELLTAVGFDPTDVGAIVTRSGLTTAEVSSMLLLLELEGHVEAMPGGRYARIK